MLRAVGLHHRLLAPQTNNSIRVDSPVLSRNDRNFRDEKNKDTPSWDEKSIDKSCKDGDSSLAKTPYRYGNSLGRSWKIGTRLESNSLDKSSLERSSLARSSLEKSSLARRREKVEGEMLTTPSLQGLKASSMDMLNNHHTQNGVSFSIFFFKFQVFVYCTITVFNTALSVALQILLFLSMLGLDPVLFKHLK
jgi:hypothetical protein